MINTETSNRSLSEPNLALKEPPVVQFLKARFKDIKNIEVIYSNVKALEQAREKNELELFNYIQLAESLQRNYSDFLSTLQDICKKESTSTLFKNALNKIASYIESQNLNDEKAVEGINKFIDTALCTIGQSIIQRKNALDDKLAEMLKQADYFKVIHGKELYELSQNIKQDGMAITSAVQETIRAMSNGDPTLLVGPTGTGKTEIAKLFSKRLTSDYILVPCSSETSKTELLYRQILGTNGSRCELTGVLKAAKEGRVVILDEFNALSPDVMISLNEILTKRVGDVVKYDGDKAFVIKSGFKIIATANEGTLYSRRTAFDPSIIDRFSRINYEGLPQKVDDFSMEQNVVEMSNDCQLFMIALAKLLKPDGSIKLPAGTSLEDVYKFCCFVKITQLENSGHGTSNIKDFKKFISNRAMINILDSWASHENIQDTEPYSLRYYIEEALRNFSTSMSSEKVDSFLTAQLDSLWNDKNNSRGNNKIPFNEVLEVVFGKIPQSNNSVIFDSREEPISKLADLTLGTSDALDYSILRALATTFDKDCAPIQECYDKYKELSTKLSVLDNSQKILNKLYDLLDREKYKDVVSIIKEKEELKEYYPSEEDVGVILQDQIDDAMYDKLSKFLDSIQEQISDSKKTIEGEFQNLIKTKEFFLIHNGILLYSLYEDLKKGKIAITSSVKKFSYELEAALTKGKIPYLVGPSGVGKTEILRYTLKRMTGKEPIVVSCYKGMGKAELVGRVGLQKGRDGNYATQDVLTGVGYALENGVPLILDEYNTLPQDVAVVLNELMKLKEGDTFILPSGQSILVKKGFYLGMTGNEEINLRFRNRFKGRVQLDLAQENRLQRFEYIGLEQAYSGSREDITRKATLWEKGELYNVILATLMNSKGIIEIPKGANLHDLFCLAQLAKYTQKVMNGDSEPDLRAIGDNTDTGVYPQLKKCLSNRALIRIITTWKHNDKSLAQCVEDELIGNYPSDDPQNDVKAQNFLRVVINWFLKGSSATSMPTPKDISFFEAICEVFGAPPMSYYRSKENNNELTTQEDPFEAIINKMLWQEE